MQKEAAWIRQQKQGNTIFGTRKQWCGENLRANVLSREDAS